MKKREQDLTKIIVPVHVLEMAERWLDTAATQLPAEASVTERRCLEVADRLRNAVQVCDHPALPEDHSAQFDIYDRAEKLFRQDRGFRVAAGTLNNGTLYFAELDYFLSTDDGKVTGGHNGESLEERLEDMMATLKLFGTVSKPVKDLHRAVWSARADARIDGELAAQGVA